MLRRFVIALLSALFAIVLAFVDGIIRDVRWQIGLHHHTVTTGQVLRYSLYYAEIAVVCAAPSVFLLAIISCIAPSFLARWYIALLLGVVVGIAATVALSFVSSTRSFRQWLRTISSGAYGQLRWRLGSCLWRLLCICTARSALMSSNVKASNHAMERTADRGAVHY